VSTEEFIRRKNIERYRQMLGSGSFAAGERDTIMRLLAKEEKSDPKNGPAPDSSALEKTIPSDKS